MSQKTQADNQQTLTYALIGVAVLLAIIVVFMIYRPSTSSTQSPAASATTASSTSLPSAMTAPKTVPFDPKTATQLPAGTTPEAALQTYSNDVTAGKFDAAYALLPLASKNTYGSAANMGSQIKAYGVTGFKMGASQVSGADTNITLEEDTAQMNVSYTWTFTKIGNVWYVKDRKIGGGSQ
jgi:cytoskeletal protein RodZ